MAPSGGRDTTNPGTTGKYRRRAYRRRGDCGRSAETPYGTVRRTIGHEVRTPEDMAPGSDQGERPRHREVGQIGEYNTGSVPGRIHPRSNDMGDDGTHTERWSRVQRHRASGGHLEGLHVDREQLDPKYHRPT